MCGDRSVLRATCLSVRCPAEARSKEICCSFTVSNCQGEQKMKLVAADGTTIVWIVRLDC